MGDRDSMWGGTTASGSGATTYFDSTTSAHWNTTHEIDQQELEFPIITLGREANIDDLLEFYGME